MMTRQATTRRSNQPVIRVVTADNHPVVRAGVSAFLDQQPDIEVVGQATNGEEALALCVELRPDVLVMDMNMPKMDGVTATQRVLMADRMADEDKNPSERHQTAVLILTNTDDEASVLSAVEAGAIGYIMKGSPIEEVLQAVHRVAAGEAAMAPAAVQALVHWVKRSRDAAPQLTQREMQVLRAVSQGLSNAEVARRLYIAAATVKTHLEHVYEKLDVTDRTRAVTRAQEMGIL